MLIFDFERWAIVYHFAGGQRVLSLEDINVKTQDSDFINRDR